MGAARYEMPKGTLYDRYCSYGANDLDGLRDIHAYIHTIQDITDRYQLTLSMVGHTLAYLKQVKILNVGPKMKVK